MAQRCAAEPQTACQTSRGQYSHAQSELGPLCNDRQSEISTASQMSI